MPKPPFRADAGAREGPPDPPADDATTSTLEILDQARTGDRSAVRELIERATPGVRRWARGRLPHYARSDGDTEDVMQDVVFRMLKNITHLQDLTVAGLQAYLRQSVINRIRDRIRGSMRRGGGPVELPEQLADAGPSPLEEAIKGERLDRFLAALGRLRPADRQVIIWRIELGYSAAEIASRLGKSPAAAGMAVTRAVARLAQELKDESLTR